MTQSPLHAGGIFAFLVLFALTSVSLRDGSVGLIEG